MAVMRYYHYTAPRNLLLSISFDAFGNITDGIDVRVLAGTPIHITKIRCVVDKYNTAWAGHIDIYVGGGTGAEATVVGLSGLGMRVCDIAEDPTIEGANLVKEFDLESMGGVIYCTAIGPYLVAYKEKGGSHEHCGKNSDFGLHQTIGAGHDSEHGIYQRLQHLYDGWSIFVHNRGRSWTATKCEPLWDTAGGDILPIRGAVIPQSRGEGIHKVIHCDRSDRPSFYNLDYTVDLTPRKEVVAA